jgi:hypothetical protein
MKCYLCITGTHTQASFNTMQYKGRDSASGIGRKLSIIRHGTTTVVAPLLVGSMITKGQMNPTSGGVYRRPRPERTAKLMAPNIRFYTAFYQT